MSIVDRLEAKGIKLKGKRSGTIKTLCPNCSHNRKHKTEPCLSVDIDKGVYNCHNCDFKGGVIQREMKEYVKPPARLEKLSPKMISWFENERKISNNTLLRAGLTQAVEYMPQKGKEMPVICFNYYRGGELINVKYRSGAKDFKMVSGAELIFYNIDALKDEKECFIVEGEIDCLTLIECGIYNVVSVPNGASKGSMKLEYLDNCWAEFEDKEKIYLLTDGDEAGNNLRTELSRRLGVERCFKFQYPEGCKDVNEVLLKHGKETVVRFCNLPEPFPVDGILGMADMYDDVCSYYENGYPEGVKIGIAGFDDYLNIRTGQMTVVTGIPGCFHKDQLIHTSIGVKPISEIKNGDKVLSYNHQKHINEYRMVYNTISHEKHNDRLYEIKMKDGTIIKVTENHEFFSGTEYVKIKDLLLSLGHEKMENDTKI